MNATQLNGGLKRAAMDSFLRAKRVARSVPGARPAPALAAGPPGRLPSMLAAIGIKSRETLYGSTIRASAERAKLARRHADVLACWADVVDWNEGLVAVLVPDQADDVCMQRLRKLRDVFGDRAYVADAATPS